jgi:hypothetical protein
VRIVWQRDVDGIVSGIVGERLIVAIGPIDAKILGEGLGAAEIPRAHARGRRQESPSSTCARSSGPYRCGGGTVLEKMAHGASFDRKKIVHQENLGSNPDIREKPGRSFVLRANLAYTGTWQN